MAAVMRRGAFNCFLSFCLKTLDDEKINYEHERLWETMKYQILSDYHLF